MILRAFTHASQSLFWLDLSIHQIFPCQNFVRVNSPNSRYTVIYIKTHDSESRGQEEAGRMRRTSELFTGNTAKINKRSK